MGDMSDTDFAEGKEGNDLKSLFDMLKSTWVSKGYGVVMGEASATDKNNLDDRLAWFKSYISKAKAINCPVILWDNMQTASTGQKDVAANCANNYSTIHPITGWSNGNINFSEANSDSQLAVTPPASGTSTATISPDSASWSTIKSNGLIVYGHKVVITKIEILN